MVLLRAVPVTVIADTGDIVGQRIQPYIHHVPVVKIHRNAPFKGTSGHAKILQPRQKEIVHHLIFAGYRLDKFRMLINMFDQPIRILAHLEKVCLLPCGLHFPAAVRTFSVL